MKTEYQTWIDAYVAKHGGDVTNMCAGATSAMIKAFPELRRERGWVKYDSMPWHKVDDLFTIGIEHWWCVSQDTEIVDPTASQFPNGITYEAYDEAKYGPLPTGKCYNCGDYVYNTTFCGNSCEDVAMDELNGGNWL